MSETTERVGVQVLGDVEDVRGHPTTVLHDLVSDLGVDPPLRNKLA